MDKNEKINPSRLMDEIIATTFTRHTGLNADDFLKEVGYKPTDDKPAPDESEYIRGSIFTLICVAAHEILRANNTIQLLNAEIKLIFNEENCIKGDKN